MGKGSRKGTDVATVSDGGGGNECLENYRKGSTTSGPKPDVVTDDIDVKPKTTHMVPMLAVFRFADFWDKLVICVAILATMVHGAMLPIMIIMIGDMTDIYIKERLYEVQLQSLPWGDYNTTMDEALDSETLFLDVLNGENATHLSPYFDIDLVEECKEYVLNLVYIACAVFVGAYLQTSMWYRASNRMGKEIRAAAFRAIMRQDIGWFDTHPSAELNTRLADDVNIIIEGTGDKLGIFLQWMATTFSGLIVGYTAGWKLALIATTAGPAIGIVGAITAKRSSAATASEMNAYASAGAVAEESIGAFRTVIAFGGQDKESKRYDSKLDSARRIGILKGAIHGAGFGATIGIVYVFYGIVFWYGSRLVREGDYTPGDMTTVFYGILIGAFALGNALPNLQYFTEARGAAYTLWSIIDTIPRIDRTVCTGEKPNTCTGNIEFRDVTFAYPSREKSRVLNGLNLKVNQGQTAALVGSSGCGKSTSIQLLQRFYDPEGGTILLDGSDIRSLNIEWLRNHIGVVSQEPVLFGTTIGENIGFGRDGVTPAEIEQAAREANVYDFINKLPERFDTMVGERGASLSGGQKQRIAIARALVRDPKILLLDEATSALDMESEATVQSALDKARQGRTTLVIAHRLSTIKTADVIFGFQQGAVVEHGTHDVLMQLDNGIYRQLVLNQTEQVEEQDVSSDDEEYRQTSIKRQKSVKRQITVDDKMQLENIDDEEGLEEAPRFWALSQNKPEVWIMVLGSIGALFNGLKQPAFSILYSEMFAVFEEPIEDQPELSRMYAYMFLGIAGLTFVAFFTQTYFFSYSGSCLTMRLRSKSFKQLLNQDAEFYDDPTHSTGALVSNLASQTSAVQGASGPQIGLIIQAVAGLGGAIIVGLVFSWKLTLVLMAFSPAILLGGLLSARQLAGASKNSKGAIQKAAGLSVEAIENIRTVTSLSKHNWFIDNYIEYSTAPFRKGSKTSHLHGLTYGWTQSITYFAYATAFYYGSYLIAEEGLLFTDMLKVVMGVVFGAMSIGQATKYMPDYAKGKKAADYLYTLHNTTSPINGHPNKGSVLDNVKGQISFKDVHFNYPSRPTVKVLRGLNFDIKQGNTVALVGSSGCGKSTSIQLIERFYDTDNGTVTLDDAPINELNVRWLRSKLGLVSQEPTLFDNTIAENIAYGDNSRTVSMNEIIEAARNANIHSFIQSLPQGYDTNVGSKGAQLSGGQKQRIAIARALLRDPKILLLDEATSALDTESEKVVQEALDAAQEGRTCITIAHRLSTIVNADQIFVLHMGRIVEAGTHTELLALQGHYYNLNQAQLKKTRD